MIAPYVAFCGAYYPNFKIQSNFISTISTSQLLSSLTKGYKRDLIES